MEIERRYLADLDSLDELSGAEDDLFDEYARGELDSVERKNFERTLLATPQQVQKLRTAQALAFSNRGRNLKQMRTQPSDDSPRWVSMLRRPRVLALVTAIAALLIVALGLSVFLRARHPAKKLATGPGNQQLAPTNLNNQQPIPQPSAIIPVRPIMALNDADGQVTIDESGNISGLGELSTPLAKTIRQVLTDQRLDITPALEGLGEKNGTLMGRGATRQPFAVLEPIGVVSRTDHPTFRWRPLAGATGYVVKIYDTNFHELLSSGSQTAPSWTAASPLARGSIYSWQVTATKDGEEIKSPVPPAPEARFRVLSQDKLNDLDHAERTHRNSHLVLGVLYADAGLLQDARREFRLLLKANPGSTLVQNLLHQVSK